LKNCDVQQNVIALRQQHAIGDSGSGLPRLDRGVRRARGMEEYGDFDWICGNDKDDDGDDEKEL
jgi:hypothetical protein